MSTHQLFQSGTRLGDFVLLERLGTGAFKTVFLAANCAPEQNRYPEKIAICIPHSQDKEAKELLKREFRTQHSLVHPAIAAVYGFEETEEYFFTVSEAVEGETLDTILKKSGPIPLEKAVSFIEQVADALDYAHEGLTVHRDIKPANIILRKDEKIKILDFGMARLMAHSQVTISSHAGTVAYMAPEQFEGAAGCSADLWSMGITFYKLITNSLPFISDDEAGLMKKILYDSPIMEPIEFGDFDNRLMGVLGKILEKDPHNRYKKASEFISDLEAVIRNASAVNKIEEEIEALIRSHFPLLYVHSYEEERVLASLQRIRETIPDGREMGFYVWSTTNGLTSHNGESLAKSAGDPLHAIKHMIESDESGIYVFLDIHQHFSPVIIRLIRDAIWEVKRKRKSLVFLSPVLTFPPELEGDVTVLFYDLPDLEALKKMVDMISEEFSVKGGVNSLEGELREGVARALLGLTEDEAGRVLRRTLILRNRFDLGCMQEALNQKRQIVKKAHILEFCNPLEGFSQVGGLNNLKEWFKKRRVAYSAKGARFGLQPPKGVILVGVPGCGKSLCAKALAKEWDVILLRLDLGKVFNKFLGASEANLRKSLHLAESVSPCILWIDELEKAFGGLNQNSDNGLIQRIFGIFLDWLSEKKSPVFVVATANDIAQLPPEFLRKGRFDDIFFVGLPQERERQEIFDVHINNINRETGDFDMDLLVKESEGYSGAEIRESVINGLYTAFEDRERELKTDDIMRSLKEIKPLSQVRENEITAMYRWAQVNARPAQAVGGITVPRWRG